MSVVLFEGMVFIVDDDGDGVRAIVLLRAVTNFVEPDTL